MDQDIIELFAEHWGCSQRDAEAHILENAEEMEQDPEEWAGMRAAIIGRGGEVY